AGCGGARGVASRSVSDLEEVYRGTGRRVPPSHRDRPTRLGDLMRDHERERPVEAAAGFARLQDARTDLAARVLAEAGVRPEQVTRVLHVFSGTERYVKRILEPLGIDPARGMLDLGRGLGHLGVNDQLVALDHLVGTGQLASGDHVLMMSNGVGASLSCAVLAIVDGPGRRAR